MRSSKVWPNSGPLARRCAAIALAVLLSGCASVQPPKPWEKGQLAKPEMQFDADPMNARLADHIYTSKEAGSGGNGVGGGGCGCN
jgi:starvation-inducible outer membrane lipoprotein